MVLPKSKVTISDVAQEAGVSNSAVSYALNGKPGVSSCLRTIPVSFQSSPTQWNLSPG